jgi:hypothetical protein
MSVSHLAESRYYLWAFFAAPTKDEFSSDD